MEYIKWENLKNIPFSLCEVKEDLGNQDIDIYYQGELVFHDYDHVGHYLRTAIELFRHVKRKDADWLNLDSLWTLRNCVRENYNHCIGVDDLIYGENFFGDFDTLTPLTKARFEKIQKTIKERDPYATV